MTRLKLVIAEAWRSITASMSTSVAATMTVLVAMFVMGTTLGLGTWLLSWSDNVKSKLLVKVYFVDTATPAQINAVGAKFDPSINPQVKKIKFVSKTEALTVMRKRFPELTANLVTNPLPNSYEITPTKGDFVDDIARTLQPRPPGVEEVNYGKKTADQILRVGGILSIVFVVGLVILLIASTLLIANTIRLSVFARRREIEVMKLVGASNWFVRGPFMVEGMICGFLGALVAVILLLLGREIVLPAVLGHIKDSGDAQAMAFELTALIMLGMGFLLGAAGSGITLRRFLRV